MTSFVSQMHMMAKNKEQRFIFLTGIFRLHGGWHLQGLTFIEKGFNNRISEMLYFSPMFCDKECTGMDNNRAYNFFMNKTVHKPGL